LHECLVGSVLTIVGEIFTVHCNGQHNKSQQSTEGETCGEGDKVEHIFTTNAGEEEDTVMIVIETTSTTMVAVFRSVWSNRFTDATQPAVLLIVKVVQSFATIQWLLIWITEVAHQLKLENQSN